MISCELQSETTKKVFYRTRDQATSNTWKKNENHFSELFDGLAKAFRAEPLALLFLDVRNFTGLLSKHSNISVIMNVKVLLNLFSQIVTANSGKVIETAGDGMYAVFGFNETKTQAVQYALAASNKIETMLTSFNDEHAMPNFGIKFEIGIGIHYGTVQVGTSNETGYDHLSVMGYAVNLASRLQTATKDLNNSLLISHEAYRNLVRKPSQRFDRIKLRGITHEVAVHRLGHAYQN